MAAVYESIIPDSAREMVMALPRLGEPQTSLTLTRHNGESSVRPVLEAFVQDRFRRTYGAEVTTFCPELLSLTRDDSSLCAVAGVRPAAQEPLYSEFYLDDAAEDFISRIHGRDIARDSIVEVGNLAPASVGQARWLIATLTAYLYSSGYEWVIFTAIPSVYNAFVRMGLPLQVYRRADIACLPPGARDQWGTYYDTGPVVCYGSIVAGFRQLSSAISPNGRKLWSLWLDAQRLGNSGNDLPRPIVLE